MRDKLLRIYQAYKGWNPLFQSALSTVMYVLLIFVPVISLVAWNLFYESMGFPWSFDFKFFSLDWLNSFIATIVEFFVNYIIRGFTIILWACFGILSLYCIFTENPVLAFIVLVLAKKFCKPILVAYTLSAIAGILFINGLVSSSQFLESVLDLSNYGWNALVPILMLSLMFFLMDYAIRLQADRMKNEEELIEVLKALNVIY